MSHPTQPTPPTPNHMRTTNVAIPDTWTPDQALAIFELIDELREKIFALYGCQIQDLLQDQQGCFQFDESNTPAPDRPF